MPASFRTDAATYEAMLDFLHRFATADTRGHGSDIGFMKDDFWLQDTAVIENIELHRGEWNIYLVFAHHLLPLKFIKRHIRQYACRNKALVSAHYMRRQAAKDQRGTLQVNPGLIPVALN